MMMMLRWGRLHRRVALPGLVTAPGPGRACDSARCTFHHNFHHKGWPGAGISLPSGLSPGCSGRHGLACPSQAAIVSLPARQPASLPGVPPATLPHARAVHHDLAFQPPVRIYSYACTHARTHVHTHAQTVSGPAPKLGWSGRLWQLMLRLQSTSSRARLVLLGRDRPPATRCAKPHCEPFSAIPGLAWFVGTSATGTSGLDWGPDASPDEITAAGPSSGYFFSFRSFLVRAMKPIETRMATTPPAATSRRQTA